jgi:SAM-dependent methyltransferase
MSEDPSQWYARWFNETYLAVYSHRNLAMAETEAAFLVRELGLRKDHRILDLCCGSGRHLLQLRNLGFSRVMGIDLSLPLLSAASESLGGSCGLVRGDMRALPFRGTFRAVLSLFTSFGYFFEEQENQRVLMEIRKALAPRGCFALDLVPRSMACRLVPHTERTIGGLHIVENRRFDPASNRVEKTIEITGPEGRQEFLESVRLYSFREVNTMLADTGLCLSDVKGDFLGTDFTKDSERMILIGKAV